MFETIAQWFLGLPAVGQAAIRAILLLLPVLMMVPLFIWWERRLLSWMQDRIGPNRVGPKGLLQPIADGVKLFFKEDITPAAVDRVIYFVAPAVALFPAFAIAGTMPWAGWKSLTPVSDANIGILYVLAISSLGVYGVVLGGYAANNKYSLMGGLRASAQLISYELAMGMSLAAVVMATGSLKMTDIVEQQTQPLWGFVPGVANWFVLTPFGFVSACIFLVCMVAETNRAPFDLPEAENELIAGYHTEYSSMKFAVFFMGEYAAMFLFSGIFATVFFGGYTVPLPIVGTIAGPLNFWLGPIWFLTKAAGFFTFFIWLRATLPRLRYDQLMFLGWKTLLPLATANFVVVTAWIVAQRLLSEKSGQVAGSAMATISVLIAGAIIYALWSVLLKKKDPELLAHREVTLTNPRRTVDLVDPSEGLA